MPRLCSGWSTRDFQTVAGARAVVPQNLGRDGARLSNIGIESFGIRCTSDDEPADLVGSAARLFNEASASPRWANSEHRLPSLCAQRTFCPLRFLEQRITNPLGTQAGMPMFRS